MNIRYQVDLLPYNTFGISAVASIFAEPTTVLELSEFIDTLDDLSHFYILGGGSNTLFVEKNYPLIIRPELQGIEIISEDNQHVTIRAAAGETWDDFVKWCVENNYAGIENLSHIPGTVGAAPIQNIGAYGVEVKDVIEKVEAIELKTNKIVTFNNQSCEFGYRDSFFKQNKGKYILTSVDFKLSKIFTPNMDYEDIRIELSKSKNITLSANRQAIINIRNRKLPIASTLGNAGSFFKNPIINSEKSALIKYSNPQAPIYTVSDEYNKISAAWLIYQSTEKCFREGNVGLYENHPLVIVNYGDATGQEILNFASKITHSVKEKFDIDLEMEVNIVGNQDNTIKM
jgi:UDP-N-acetylmuramate dehydrogenase